MTRSEGTVKHPLDMGLIPDRAGNHQRSREFVYPCDIQMLNDKLSPESLLWELVPFDFHLSDKARVS